MSPTSGALFDLELVRAYRDLRLPAAMFDETVLACSEYIQFESSRPITLFENILFQCIQIEYLTICRFIYLNVFSLNIFYLSHLK